MTPLVKINGFSNLISGIRCRPGDVHFSWSFTDFNTINYQNLKFDLLISNSSSNLGTDAFVGSRFSLKSFSASVGNYIFSPSVPLDRNFRYYGQIRFFDGTNSSNWVTFILDINSMPDILNPVYSNVDSTGIFNKGQDVILSFTNSREDVNSEIKWYRNNILQGNLTNSLIVPSNRVSLNDVWYAQITAYDDLEVGSTKSLPRITARAPTPVVNYLQILPPSPTEDDILEASYSLLEDQSDNIIINDVSKIFWYVNDELIESVNNKKFVRLNLREGDNVYFEIEPENFENYGEIKRSPAKQIASSGYYVYDLSVDGKFNDILVTTDQPIIRWKVKKPGNINPNYIKIIIGTREGADDIISEIMQYTQDEYMIPAELLKSGARYFISIAASLDSENFSNYGKISFKLIGNFWKDNVSNATGYTLLFKLKTHTLSSGSSSDQAAYAVQIADGKYYVEIIEYLNKVKIIFNENDSSDIVFNTTNYHEMVVGIKEKRIFVFLNGEKKYDADILSKTTLSKYITLRSKPDGSNEISLEIERLNINVDGIYEPGVSDIYAKQSFEEKASFPEGYISDIASKSNHFIVALNSYNDKEASKLYKYIPDQEYIRYNVTASQSGNNSGNSNNSYRDLSTFIFNNIEKIPNVNKTAISHVNGSVVMSDLPVFIWDVNTKCESLSEIIEDKWTVKYLSSNSLSINQNHVLFDTSFETNGSISNSIVNGSVSAIRIERNSFFNLLEYNISYIDGYIDLNIESTNESYLSSVRIDMRGKNLNDFVQQLKNVNISSSPSEVVPFGIFYDVFVVGNYSSYSSDSIISFGPVLLNDSYDIYIGPGDVLDPYAVNAYSAINNSYAYIAQNIVGDPWNSWVDNNSGYVIQFDIKSLYAEDSINPNLEETEGSFGLYINDGLRKLSLDVLPKSLIVNKRNKHEYNFNDNFSTCFLAVKSNQYRLWLKSNSEWINLSNGNMVESYDATTDKNNLFSTSRNGYKVVCWEESSAQGREIKYSYRTQSLDWSKPLVLVSSDYYPSKCNIAIDSFGNLHAVFEIYSNTKSDIGYSVYKNNKWSTPVKIVDQSGDSHSPKIICDEYNNLYVSWIDRRSGKSDIFSCQYIFAQSRWISSGFSGVDQQVSNAEVEVNNIDHAYKAGNYYIVWSEKDTFGRRNVKLAKYSTGSKQWYSSFFSGNDFSVSVVGTSKQADYPSICIDFDNQVHVVWQDVVSGFNRIFYRQIASSLVSSSIPQVITSIGYGFDCKKPILSLIDEINDPYTANNGDMVLVFQKVNNSSVDPVDPTNNFETNYSSYGNSIQEIYACRWSRDYKKWLSSGSKVGTEGGYDTLIKPPASRYISLISIPKSIENIQDIFYLGTDSHAKDSPVLVYNLRYDMSFKNGIYSADIDEYMSFDPDEIITVNREKKQILFGISSSYLAGRLAIKNIKLSAKDYREPFSLSYIGSANYNIPNANCLYSRANSYGDVWLQTIKNLIFVSPRKNIAFDVIDEKNDLITHFRTSSSFDNSSTIKSLYYDKLGNIFVSVNNSILISNDHYRFFLLKIDDSSVKNELNDNFTFIREYNDDLILANNSKLILIKNYKNEILSKVPYNDPYESDNIYSIDLPTLVIKKIELNKINSGINYIFDLASDSDYVWVSTNIGLYQISSNFDLNAVAIQFDQVINSNAPAVSIDCVDSNIRFIASYNKAYISSGASIKPINTNAVYVDVQGTDREFLQDSSLVNLIDVIKIKYIDPKNILVLGRSKLYRLIFDDIFSYETKYVQIFDETNLDINFVSNISSVNSIVPELRQKFNFPPIPDDNEGKYYVEVFLNQKRITRGYRVSTKYGILYFEDGLLSTDEVYIKIRKDIRLYNDFALNMAEIEAFGAKVYDTERLFVQDNDVYSVITDGVTDFITTRNELIKLPYDEIVIDKTPPIAKLEYVEQVSPQTVKLRFVKLRDSSNNVLEYDEVSGVSSMVISNYDNFTSNGITAKDPEPFKEEFLYDINLNNSAASLFAPMPAGVVASCGNYFKRSNETRDTILIGTQYPARVYALGADNLFESSPITLDAEADSKVEFLYRYNGVLIAGVSKRNGSAKIYTSNDGRSFVVSSTLSANGISNPYLSPYDRKLYVGGYRITDSTINGTLYSYDGAALSVVQNNLDHGVISVSGFSNIVVFGTMRDDGLDTHIYKVDLQSNSVAIIIHSEASDIISMTSRGTAIYAGLKSGGKIIRSLNTGIPFITSLRTNDVPIKIMRTLIYQGIERVFAGVGKSIYYLINTWNLRGNSTTNICDVFSDGYNNIIYVSENAVNKIITTGSSNIKIFAKLIDNAGNQTDINGDPDTNNDNYNDNLLVEIGTGTGNEFNFNDFSISNAIVEINGQTGEKIRVIQGDSPFYSADKILVEVGVYETEIFNATSGHIAWGNISWEVVIPANTDIYFEIRSGSSREQLLNSNYDVALPYTSNNYDLSFLTGQYLQVRIVLRSSSASGLAPSVKRLNIVSLGSSSSEVFTVNFSLPSRVKRGILTSQKELSFGSSIIFGINTLDDTNFSNYQIIPENRIFTTEDIQSGNNLRIGVRLLTSQIVGQIANPIPDSDPYASAIFANSLIWSYTNSSISPVLVDFKIEVFSDYQQADLLFSTNTISNPNFFKVDGENYPSQSAIVESGKTKYFSFIPYGLPLQCDSDYYCRIYLISGGNNIILENNVLLRKQCGTNFFNSVSFDFINELGFANFHFRIRFFTDEARNTLVYSFFSQIDNTNWYANGNLFPSGGVDLATGDIVSVELKPNFEQYNFEVNKKYYISIDAYDGEKFSWNNNSYVFQVSQVGNGPSCGTFENVPVLRSFAMMFELENGEMIRIRLDR